MTGQDHGGVLNFNDPVDPSNPECSVCDALTLLLNLFIQNVFYQQRVLLYPIVFDALDALVIRAAALCTVDADGLSGIDACRWLRLCTSFCAASGNFVVQLLFCQVTVYCIAFSRYSLYHWNAGPLLWTSP